MKGIEFIPNLTDDQKKLLEQSALQYKRFARIYIEVVGCQSQHVLSAGCNMVYKPVIDVKIQQKESPNGKYLTAKELKERSVEVFNDLIKLGVEIAITAVPYKFLEVVDLAYIEKKKKELGLTDADIARLLDIRKENISRLFNEARGLTKWHQAAFYYLFKSLEKNK